jgi:hypothetical protein
VLTIDPDSDPITFNGGHPLADFPLVNQQLVPVMIYDQIEGLRVLRYPGAVFTDPNPLSLYPPASGYLVRVPVVTAPVYPGGGREAGGEEGRSSPAQCAAGGGQAWGKRRHARLQPDGRHALYGSHGRTAAAVRGVRRTERQSRRGVARGRIVRRGRAGPPGRTRREEMTQAEPSQA